MSQPVNAAHPFHVSTEMYKEQRQRLGATIKKDHPAGDHAALLQSGSEVNINSTDCVYLFVQESYFYYLFGTEMPDCYGAVFADGTGAVFIPRLPADFATWMGPLPTCESVKAATGMEAVYYIDEMKSVLLARGIKVLDVLEGKNTDSGLNVLSAKMDWDHAGMEVSKSYLYNVLTRQRCYKTALETKVLEYVCKVSSDAHIKVMRTVKPGLSQHHLESTFLHEVYYHGGCRKVSYTCICATGCHGATLHYPNNDAMIQPGDMALLDMGGNYHGYAADITCSYPVNGSFTPAQKTIYEAVLDAHDRVLKAMKPGLPWVDMHKLAIRTTCEHLVRAGVLLGDVDTLMQKQVMQYFQPHGLGHLIGLDVHDVGGYMEGVPERPTEKDCCRLRTARVLEEGLYITVEPGCYFNAALMQKLREDPDLKGHVNEAKLEEYKHFGGVRIESDVLVTKDGIINYTCVPRTVEEIEKVMSGADFSKAPETYKNA